MKKPAVFFGWYIIAAGALLIAFSSVITYGFTAFIDPIAATFGWSYAQISFAMSLRGLETGAMNPLLGVAVDRLPARILVAVGIAIFAAGLLCLSQTANLAMFYIGFLIMGLGMSLFASMIPPTMAARWFRKDIGKASGILALGAGLGGPFIPLLVEAIDNFGWQRAMLLMAIAVMVMGLPLALVFRNKPEDYGLLPDGKLMDDSNEADDTIARYPDISIGNALKMRAFWHFGVSTALTTAAWAAIVIYIIPFSTSLGIERSRAALVPMIILVASLGGRLLFGLLADIYVKKHLWVFSNFLMIVGTIILWLIKEPSFFMLIGFAVFFGLGISSFLPLRTPIFLEYFGIKNFATILGLSSVFLTIGMVASPPLVGWIYERIGLYGPIWSVLTGVSTLGMIVMATIPPPDRQKRKGCSAT